MKFTIERNRKMVNSKSKINQFASKIKPFLFVHRLYGLLAPRAYSVIMFTALFYTLAVKFFQARRVSLVNEYLIWILADIAVLLAIEAVLVIVCFLWPRKVVIRLAIGISAVVYTWSVMNAGWLVRTGTQILPPVLLPLLRDPLNALRIIGVNLLKMPVSAVVLLAPSAVALTFFLFVFAKPQSPHYNRKRMVNRTIISCIFIFVAVLAHGAVARRGSAQGASAGLRYNCQLRALTYFLSADSGHRAKIDFADARRKIPAFDQIQIAFSPDEKPIDYNLVVVILEGVQYRHTSLYDKRANLTPYFASLANQGIEFVNARSTLTHTTKVVFSLLTGQYPSVSQDIAEAVPVLRPYAGIATILKQKLNFRTAFFQSAKGNFESRPGLVYNLGFDKFWARDDLSSRDAFLGYLACDEFEMLKPIIDWIKADPVRDTGETLSNRAVGKVSNGDDKKPFFLTILCSVTHDPYEVPEWFANPAKEPIERYRQAISYTDKFVAALDVELTRLNLADKTIFCVIGDHGEAFGEHGLFGHERIAFEEVLHIPFTLRAPFLVEPATRVIQPVSSVDLTPTLLTLLGFDTSTADFDGLNALGRIPDDRKVYFSGWMQQSPAGFVKANRKFIYYPTTKTVSVYDLSIDPLELIRIELPEQQVCEIADGIIAWRKNSIFRLNQEQTGKKTLFGGWLCRWNNRVCSAKYQPEPKN